MSGDIGTPVLPDPLTGMGVELLLFSTPDDWVSRINDLEQQIYKGVRTAIDASFDKIEHLNWAEVGAISVVDPGLGLGLGAVKKWFGHKMNGIADKVWSELDQLWQELQTAVDVLIGDPGELLRLSQAYLDAKTTLNEVYFRATHEQMQLAKYWKGLGFTSYTNASGEQTQAIDAVATKLDSAATLVSSSAQAIKLTWSAIVQALLALVADLINKVASGLDLGNIASGDSGPILSIVSSGVTFVNSCSKAIRDVDAAAGSSGKMAWMELSSGSRAFQDGDSWPMLDLRDSSQYQDPRSWTATA